MTMDIFEARTHISEKCEKYNIPHFNWGAQRPYANVEAFISVKIMKVSYPQNFKKLIFSSNVKNFSVFINLCILLALDHFEKFFNENIRDLKRPNNNINKFYEKKKKIL